MKEDTTTPPSPLCCTVNMCWLDPPTTCSGAPLAEASPLGTHTSNTDNSKDEQHVGDAELDDPPLYLYYLYHAVCLLSAAGLTACVFVSIVRPWWRGTATIPMYPSASLLESTPSHIAKAALIFGSNLVTGVLCAFTMLYSSACGLADMCRRGSVPFVPPTPWYVVARIVVLVFTLRIVHISQVHTRAHQARHAAAADAALAETIVFRTISSTSQVAVTWGFVVLETIIALSAMLLQIPKRRFSSRERFLARL